MVNIIITSGGTQEYIDDVRVLTNISTGKLGALIATEIPKHVFANIFYIHAKGSRLPEPQEVGPKPNLIEVRSAQDTLLAMEKVMRENDIHFVIHSMAVSDFTFKKDESIKLKSNDPKGFIEYMSKTITVNPKIISAVKKWDPRTTLIGFKFEVGLDHEKLIGLAKYSIEKNGCDLVIANDKKEMNTAHEHIAHFVFSEGMKETYGFIDGTVISKQDIANKLAGFVARIATRRGV